MGRTKRSDDVKELLASIGVLNKGTALQPKPELANVPSEVAEVADTSRPPQPAPVEMEVQEQILRRLERVEFVLEDLRDILSRVLEVASPPPRANFQEVAAVRTRPEPPPPPAAPVDLGDYLGVANIDLNGSDPEELSDV